MPNTADMYSRWALDCIIELAQAVSNDFISRPHLYQVDRIPDEIVDLRMSYGTIRALPNTQQRQLMHMPIFGRSDGLRPDNSMSPFHTARKKLIDASIAYAERVYDTGLDMLKERIRSAVIPINHHLHSVEGRSLEASSQQTEQVFTIATDILRNPGIAKVFGVDPAATDWPLDSDDPNGAKLVEAIGTTLRVSPEYVMTHEKFVLLQRVAREGRDALTAVLKPDPANDKNLETLVTKVYAWGTSLLDFQS